MPPGGLGKIALCAMPVGLEDSPNGHGFAALWVEFPSDPLRAVVPCSMPKRFAFSAQNTVPPFRASQLCPFFMSWNGKRPSLVFSSRGTGKLPSGNNPLRLRLFFMRNRETFTKRESAAAPQPFPRPLQSSAFLQNVKDARIKPVALVGGEGLKTDFEVAGIDRSAVHGFDFTDGEFPLVP